VLLLDEFDAFAKLRDDPQEVGEIKRVVNALLQNLDTRRDVGLTVGITNHPHLLDSAVWRRFEVQLEIPKPDFSVRVEIARHFMPPVSAPETHLRMIAWFTDGATGAEIETLVRTYKKAMAVQNGEERLLLDTLRQFATLNSGRIDATRKELIFSSNGLLFRTMREDQQLGFSLEDIGRIAGKDKSTIARTIKKDSDDNEAVTSHG
jgi:SpoVK/Ycf46/Vps4 family AAA+-type ATPase